MVNAYILVRLIPGLESSAMSQMRVIPGVKDVITVFGRWDAIVQVESKTIPALSRMVIGQIRGIQGVQATETLVAAEL
ncbi:MAG: Lrp/AsnC ligand binding domain-containing protein [candidate division NC10 bacterium]|jgi:DNA-binding Lrp family transcriptional regulator